MNQITRYLFPAAALAGVAVLVAACSSATSGAAAPSSSATRPGSAGSGQFGASGSGFGGAGGAAVTGTIAAVAGSSMEVQNPTTGQSTVTFTAKTVFTQQQKVAASAITVGSCILARAAAPSTAGGSSSSAPSSAPSVSPTTPLAATSVQVSAPVNGTCSLGGARPSGAPTGYPGFTRPPGSTGTGTGGAGAGYRGTGRAFGAVVAGKVTATAGGTITVAALSFAQGTAGGATTARTVTIGPATTITTAAHVAESAVKTGLCAAAFGPTDTTGTVAATRVSLSSPVAGQCTSGGFGRGGFGRGTGTGGNA